MAKRSRVRRPKNRTRRNGLNKGDDPNRSKKLICGFDAVAGAPWSLSRSLACPLGRRRRFPVVFSCVSGGCSHLFLDHFKGTDPRGV